MKFPLPARYRVASLPIALSLSLFLPALAQRPAPEHARPAPAAKTATATKTAPPATTQAAVEKSPSVTFDTLLSADAYAVYAEMRMLGQHANSEDMLELLAPLNFEGGGAARQLLALHEFVKTHADALMTARLMFATMPVRDGLPDILLAVEMPSVEEARKFEPELRQFVAASVESLLPGVAPAATGTTAISATLDPSHTMKRRGRRGARGRSGNTPDGARAKQPAAPAFRIRRAGNLLAMSNANFTFRDLHGKDRALLVNEPGFQTARTQFGTDALFVYINSVRMSNSTKRRMEAYEKEYRRQAELEAEAGKRGAQSNSNLSIVDDTIIAPGDDNMNAGGNTNSSRSVGKTISTNANVAVSPEDETPPPPGEIPEATPAPKTEKELEEERRREQSQRLADTLASLIFSGRGTGGETWPESIGIGVSPEAEAIVLRGLFVSPSAEQPLRPIPFLPVLLSGPSIAAGAPSVLPADTDIFLTLSLDLPQMYDHLASLMKIADLVPAPEEARIGLGEQLSAFEKTNNFRIREELIAALGNEIAFGMGGDQFFGGGPARVKTDDSAPPPASGPIVVIALNDKEGLQKLLPRVLHAFGFAGATEQSVVEKHGQVEVITFSNGTLAFIDRFLVGAPDAATMRRITDAYNSGETLASNERFRNATSWQAAQALGQVYVSNGMLKGMFADVIKSAADIDDPAIRAYLLRLDPEPGAVTHLVTRESNGLMHELRLPNNLLALLSTSSLVSQKLWVMRSNESTVQWKLQALYSAQKSYKESKGVYGTFEELLAAGYIDKDHALPQAEGYEIKLSVSGDRFEATATPTGYPKLGRRSYYIDQTGSLRGDDTGGKPASSASTPIIN